MMLKALQHRFEAAACRLFLACMRKLPLDKASALGGRLARFIGSFMGPHRTARMNLARFMPELTRPERERVLSDMWDHLGRVAAEMAHLNGHDITQRITFTGSEHMPKPGEAALFFSGHFGNWELLPYVSRQHGVPVTLIYREANNRFVDEMISEIRSHHAGGMFPKGPRGAVRMARAIKHNEAIAMLVDQKMNDGIAVPFFGVDAMTAPAIAQVALRYDLPIHPAYVLRKGGAHFEAHMLPALQYEKTGDVEKDTLAIMTAINTMIESWIRAHPEQWFWVHKRWPG